MVNHGIPCAERSEEFCRKNISTHAWDYTMSTVQVQLNTIDHMS